MPIEEELKKAKSPEELEEILTAFLNAFLITESQAKSFYDQYFPFVVSNYIDNLGIPQQTKDYILQYTSSQDLADRLHSYGGMSSTEATKIYGWLSQAPDMALRGARGRETQKQEEQQRGARAEALSQTLLPIQKNKYASKLLWNISDAELEKYLSGGSNELLSKLSNVWTQAGQAERADVALAGTQALEFLPKPTERLVDTDDFKTKEIAESFLGEKGFAEGTKLRSFLEQQTIPKVLEESRAAREEWYQKLHPEQTMSSTDEMGLLQDASRRWGNIMEWAPSDEVLGGVSYGEGGLRALAEKAYADIQARLATRTEAQTSRARGLQYVGGEEAYEKQYGPQTLSQKLELLSSARDAGYGEMPKPPPGPDPLIKALREKEYLPEYYRRPGTGLVNRLTPAVRW